MSYVCASINDTMQKTSEGLMDVLRTDAITRTKTLSNKRLTYVMFSTFYPIWYIDGLMQERHNSIANALELCFSCINSSIYA